MAEPLITHFDPEPSLLAPLLSATDYDPWYPETCTNLDWPGNILSKQVVIYGDGTIARQGDPVTFAVDPGELNLCQRLAAEAGAAAHKLYVPRCSGGQYFGPFYNVARDGSDAPGRIDAELVRDRFGGTLCPLADINIDPLDESGLLWHHVDEQYEPDEPRSRQWKDLIRWFGGHPEFVDSADVLIGDNLENEDLSDPDLLKGAETYGVVMPRLIVGLTRRGSLVGLSGCAVLA